jgi:RNA polymerase sigma-70 factor (ECF subfamily)
VTLADISRLEAIQDAAAEFVMDEEAFRAFYDRNARGVWAYLVRLTGNRNSADDLLQETFYRFLRAAADHDDETHRRNSLYRIATNLARDARRRSLLRPAAWLGGDSIERMPADGAENSRRETPELRRAFLSQAMGLLKPRERAMLWLAYAEGASHREIAKILGLKPASMKPLLFRARRRLAALLGVKS